MNIFIILPTQLFEYNEYLDKMDKIYIIEDEFYFTSKVSTQLIMGARKFICLD